MDIGKKITNTLCA